MGAHPMDELRYGVVGSGRVGQAMARMLAGMGHRVVGVTSSQSLTDNPDALPHVAQLSATEVVSGSQLVVLAVPDDVLGQVVEDPELPWHTGQIVVHTSGAYGASILEPIQRQGAFVAAVHPAMTFSGTSLDDSRLVGATFAISANPLVVPVVSALVEAAGGVPLVVPEAGRGLYHAALCHAANHAVTLVAQAREILTAAGVDDASAVLRPLVEAAVLGASDGGDKALTGPVSRGDVGTVRGHVRHLERAVAMQSLRADVLATYQDMAGYTAARARSSGRISEGVCEAVAAVVSRDAVGETPTVCGGDVAGPADAVGLTSKRQHGHDES